MDGKCVWWRETEEITIIKFLLEHLKNFLNCASNFEQIQ